MEHGCLLVFEYQQLLWWISRNGRSQFWLKEKVTVFRFEEDTHDHRQCCLTCGVYSETSVWTGSSTEKERMAATSFTVSLKGVTEVGMGSVLQAVCDRTNELKLKCHDADGKAQPVTAVWENGKITTRTCVSFLGKGYADIEGLEHRGSSQVVLCGSPGKIFVRCPARAVSFARLWLTDLMDNFKRMLRHKEAKWTTKASLMSRWLRVPPYVIDQDGEYVYEPEHDTEDAELNEEQQKIIFAAMDAAVSASNEYAELRVQVAYNLSNMFRVVIPKAQKRMLKQILVDEAERKLQEEEEAQEGEESEVEDDFEVTSRTEHFSMDDSSEAEEDSEEEMPKTNFFRKDGIAPKNKGKPSPVPKGAASSSSKNAKKQK